MGMLGIAQQGRLGDFDFEALRRHSRNVERVANLAQEVALMKLLWREIDRYTDRLRPLHAFQARLAEDPATEIDDHAHVLGDRNDIDRRHRAAKRMIPPQQRLAGRYLAALQIDERLIKALEFLVRERPAQIEFENAARLDDLRHFFAEETEGAAAVRLGTVERHVGVLQKRVGADVRGHRDADAGPDLDQVIVDLVPLAEVVDDTAGKCRPPAPPPYVLLEHAQIPAPAPPPRTPPLP